MMIMVFWLLAAVLVVVALVLVLRPQLVASAHARSARETNLALLRRRFREMQTEHERGELATAEFSEAQAELERELLEQTAVAEWPTKLRSRPRELFVIAFLIPTFAIAIYLGLGGTHPLRVQAQLDAVADDPEAAQDFVRANIGKLESRVIAEPQRLESWLMLARAYQVIADDAAVRRTLTQAYEHVGEESQLLLAHGEYLIQAGNAQDSARGQELIMQLLRREPDHLRALWLAGVAASNLKQFSEAVGHWRRLQALLPEDSSMRSQINAVIAQVQDASVTP